MMSAFAALAENEAISAFRDLYHNHRAPWTQVFWRGHQVAKCPMDLWIYQEILFETKPDLIIETGSNIGGSAYFFASIFDMIGHGRVVTVDKDRYPNQPQHPRITYLVGDSTSDEIAYEMRAHVGSHERDNRTMVALDSLHTYEHVSRELALYGSLVSEGHYLVVEDTAVDQSWGKPAARAAAQEFMATRPYFTVDESRERQMLTLNPGGWIRREC